MISPFVFRYKASLRVALVPQPLLLIGNACRKMTTTDSSIAYVTPGYERSLRTEFKQKIVCMHNTYIFTYSEVSACYVPPKRLCALYFLRA